MTIGFNKTGYLQLRPQEISEENHREYQKKYQKKNIESLAFKYQKKTIDHVQISILASLEIRKLHCLYLEHAISIILIDLLEVKNNLLESIKSLIKVFPD